MSFDTASGGPAPSRFRVWIHALRAPFLTASGIPVLLGAFAAFWRTGDLDPGKLGLALGGVLSIHLGANLANDYFDEATGCDRLNPQPTPFSGGSRVIQAGLLTPKTVLVASVCFLTLGLAQGLWLNMAVPGNTVLVLGIAGVACGLLYTAVPFKLSYRGMGEVLVFLAFGPLIVAGSYACQTGGLEVFALAVSVPAGMLVVSILLINEILDVEWDRRAGKRTLIVALGLRRGYLLYFLVFVGAFAWMAVGMLLRVFPTLAAFAFLPAVVFTRRLVPGKALADRPATITASRLTIMSHTITVGMLALSYLVS